MLQVRLLALKLPSQGPSEPCNYNYASYEKEGPDNIQVLKV